MRWDTRFTKVFECKLPIMGAPMAGVSGARLAFETCRAGGLGFIAAGHMNSKEAFHKLEKEIVEFQELSNGVEYPLAIGFICHSTFATELGWNLFENVLEDYQPQVVQFFAPWISYSTTRKRSTDIVKLAHSYGCKVVVQVGTVDDAIQAMDARVDCIVAQGTEAGGHGLRLEYGSGTMSLVANIVACAAERSNRTPILAAGGIMDGKGLNAALALGADGVVLGTRLWASVEAQGPTAFKEALVAAKSGDDVVRTRAFDAICNSYRTVKWPAPYDSSGVLRNRVTCAWDKKMPELEAELKKNPDGSSKVVAEFKKAETTKDIDGACIYAGKGVGKVKSIEPAYQIITRMAQEALDGLNKLQSSVVAENGSKRQSSCAEI